MAGRDPDYESISVLIQPSKEGDADAQANLLEQLQGYVRFMAETHFDQTLKQKAGYSDIAQETMARVVENFNQFKGSNSVEFRAWLKQIVINEIHRIRRNYRTAKRDVTRERNLEVNPTSTNFGGDLATDSNRTPSSEAIAREQVEQFQDILAELPEDYAQVIKLRSLNKLPFKEVAQQMGRSHDAVTKLWYRAILQLEEKLKENDIEI